MKKIINKISTLVLALTFMFLNIISAGAYDQNITISESIDLPFVVYENTKNTLSVSGDLKNNDAVVNLQYVKLTQAQFEAIDAKYDANKVYADEQTKIVEQMANNLKAEKTKIEELKVIAEKEGATEEQKKAYNDAIVAYNNNLDAYSAKVEEVNKKIASNNTEARKLIPSYDDTKWTKLTLKESTTYSNKYEFDGIENTSYYVVWAKVSLNGQDYYSYEVYCDKEEPEYYCEIVDGKYYNNSGKEVTKAEYEADCEEKKYCEIVDGKYYNKAGKEVTKAEYEADCLVYEEPKLCKIEDGKYYDNEGFEVSKEDYEKACTTPDNPKTGTTINIAYGVLITLVAISSYAVVRKVKKFSR